MATYSPELLYKKIDDAQEIFGGLSQTSQFMVSLNLGRSAIRQRGIGELNRYLTNCGLFSQSKGTSETYDFLCSDATLPGSTFNVIEETGSRQGMIERFPMQRIYSEFDLTFYVDREYNVIHLFENWISFIANERRTDSSDIGPRIDDPNASYRFSFPKEYQTEIFIKKFEKDYKKSNRKTLQYKFMKAFPLSISQMPVSYASSELLKCTVSFAYSRYVVN